MRRLEFSASILLILFSLAVCREAYKLSLGQPGRPGPGLVPFILSVALFLLSGSYFFTTLWKLRREKEIHLWQGLRWKKAMLVVVMLFAYALFLEKVGFLLSTLLFLMAIFTWVDKTKWYWIYLGSPGITFLFYAVFKLWLKIQLPVGLLSI